MAVKRLLSELVLRRRRTAAGNRRQRRQWFVLVGAPVLAAVLAAWLTPAPRIVKELLFPSKTEPQIGTLEARKRYAGLPTALCGSNYVSRSLPTGLDAHDAEGAKKFANWAAEHQLSIGTSYADAVISSPSKKTIVLMRLDIDVVRRSPQLQGGATFEVKCPGYVPPALSIEPTRYISADLDHDPPVVRTNLPKDGLDDYARVVPMKWPLTVTDEDLEYFHINVSTKTCDCLWRATLTWSAGGKVSTSAIDDDGKPFRVVGEKIKLPHLQYSPSDRRWKLCHDGKRCAPMIFNKRGGLETKD